MGIRERAFILGHAECLTRGSPTERGSPGECGPADIWKRWARDRGETQRLKVQIHVGTGGGKQELAEEECKGNS